MTKEIKFANKCVLQKKGKKLKGHDQKTSKKVTAA